MRPILFKIFGIPIHSYGLMLSISFLLGTLIAAKRAEKDGIKEEDYISATLWVMVAIMLGARFFYVIQNISDYNSILDIFAVWKGGLVLYGGLIGGVLGGILIVRIKKIPVAKYFDAGAPSIGLGVFFTRIGCFLNGCCFGAPTTLPWGLSFPKGTKVFSEQVFQHIISKDDSFSLPVHPTQIYDSLNGIFIFFLLLYLARKRRFYGETMLQFVMIYAVTRFIIEFARGDSIRGFIGPLSTSQFFGIVFFIVAGSLYVWGILSSRMGKKD